MKRKMILTSCICVSVLLSGCGSNAGSQQASQTPSVNDVLEAGMQAYDAGKDETQSADPAQNDTVTEIIVPLDDSDEGLFDFGDGYERQSGINEGAPDPEEMEEIYTSTEGIDVDLTVLSSTMVYSQVFDMLYEPDKYIGKTVKMNGMYVCTDPELSEEFYCACIIQDATLCCSQGIEFVLSDEYAFPEDYPEYEDTISVIGTFDTYMDDGYTYCTLRNARLLDT